MAHYNCAKCPGYCCSYPIIGLTKRDVERLAKHHEISFEKAKTTFTRDDVWIYISMTNIDAAPLLPDIVATAWAV